MKIAITGGIAEGKSTVLAHLGSLGYAVASADEIAREIRDDPAVQARIAEALGITLPFDVAKLRERVAQSESARRQLNQLLHPETRRRIQACEASFIEVPLLIEAVLMSDFDQIWVVTCGIAEQRRRLVARLQNEALADQILASQLKTRAKLPFADKILRTNAAPETVFFAVENQVQEVFGVK
jgi:dephospho-CoA kinase